MWTIKFSKQAEKDKHNLKEAGLDTKTKKILNLMTISPYQNPPRYEKLVGDLVGYYSRRINIKHRIVYRVIEKDKTIVIHSMWTHYEK